MQYAWTLDLPGFVPVKPLGAGGFGQVWLARQTDLDRLVAVKVGHSAPTTDDDRRRFERECKALGRLGGHPNIVQVHTSGFAQGVPYLVLTYVDGGTLADHGPSLDEGALRSIALQLCDAVTAAHNQHVLHRDLKPENVFLTPEGHAILGDFGIARLGDGNNTTAGMISASLPYVAPELLEGAEPSIAGDVYGIGITLISAILGHSPFVTDPSPPAMVMHNVATAEIPALDPGRLSPPFEAVLRNAMARNPELRPASAAELRRAIEELPGAIPDPTAIATAPISRPLRNVVTGPANGRGSPLRLVAAAAAFVVLAIVATFVVANRQSETAANGTDGSPTQTAEPVLPPLVLPLLGADISRLTPIPFDSGGVDQLLGPANSTQFCGDRPTITGLVDTLAGAYPADTSLRQFAQRVVRFSSPEGAVAFVSSHRELSCSEWEDLELVPGEVSEISATVVVSTLQRGDEVAEIDQRINFASGLTSYSRTTLIRNGTDVLRLFYITLEPDELGTTTNVLADVAADNLGY